MPLAAPTVLTTFHTSADQHSYSTAAVEPAPDHLVLVAVQNHKGSTNTLPTLSGCSMTWVQVTTVTANGNRLTVFRGLASSGITEGPITADYAGAVQTYCEMAAVQIPDVILTGTSGADAVRQATVAQASAVPSMSVSLEMFGSQNNATIGVFGIGPLQDIFPGDGFAEIVDFGNGSANRGLFIEWRSDNDASVDASWETAGTAIKLGIALEIVPRPDLPIPAGSIGVPVRLSAAEVAIPHPINVPVFLHTPVEQFRIVPAPVTVRTWVHPARVDPSGPLIPNITAGSIPVTVTVHPATAAAKWRWFGVEAATGNERSGVVRGSSGDAASASVGVKSGRGSVGQFDGR